MNLPSFNQCSKNVWLGLAENALFGDTVGTVMNLKNLNAKNVNNARSLAGWARGGHSLFELWLASALCLWGAGIVLPVLLVTKFYFFEDVIALWPATQMLAAEGELLLAGVVFAFTLLFPVLKLIGLWLAYRLPMDRAAAKFARKIVGVTGKWSMLDVFVVALVVVMLKGSWVADAQTGPGLYCFFGAVLLTMMATFHLSWMQRAVSEAREDDDR